MSNRRKISNSDVFNSIQRDSCDKALVQDLHLIFVFSAGIGIGITSKCLSLAGYSASFEKSSSCPRGRICCLVQLSPLPKDDRVTVWIKG